jgi:hypothetical protein
MSFFRILVLATLMAGVAHAQMYKWVDENGRTQYTQTPPPPGKKAEVIQSQKKAPAAAETAPVAPTANNKKGKAQPAVVDDGIPADVKRLAGEWNTRSGDPVQVRFRVSAGAPSFLVSQAWGAEGKTSIGNDKRYVLNGVDGRGILTAVDKPEGQDAALPTVIRYQFQAEVLVLTVDAGPYAGQHRLRRPETK